MSAPQQYEVVPAPPCADFDALQDAVEATQGGAPSLHSSNFSRLRSADRPPRGIPPKRVTDEEMFIAREEGERHGFTNLSKETRANMRFITGMRQTATAEKLGISTSAMQRHVQGHLRPNFAAAKRLAAEKRAEQIAAREEAAVERAADKIIEREGSDLVATTQRLRARQFSMLEGAEQDDDRPGFSGISREIRGSVRLEAELTGEITHKVSIDAQLRESRPEIGLSDDDQVELAQIWHKWLVRQAGQPEIEVDRLLEPGESDPSRNAGGKQTIDAELVESLSHTRDAPTSIQDRGP